MACKSNFDFSLFWWFGWSSVDLRLWLILDHGFGSGLFLVFFILLGPVGFLRHALLMARTEVEQGKPNHTNTFQASPHISSINPFDKANHMAKVHRGKRKGKNICGTMIDQHMNHRTQHEHFREAEKGKVLVIFMRHYQ